MGASQQAARTNWPVFIGEWYRGIYRDPKQLFAPHLKRTCPICSFHGQFINAGYRLEARCPGCGAKERDRSIGLYLQRHLGDLHLKKILHFSAERPFFRLWKKFPFYVAGDIKKSRVANAVVDITDIRYPHEHFDLIVCNHVLEHVPDDEKGIAECFRVLKKGGTAIFSVPIDSERPVTWEPPPEMSKEEVEKICGWDHLRLYGLDFPKRLEAAGFTVSRLNYSEEEKTRHRLADERDEMIVAARKN